MTMIRGNWFDNGHRLKPAGHFQKHRLTGSHAFIRLIYRQRKMCCKSTCDRDLETRIKVSSDIQTLATVATLHLCFLKDLST